jgi:hypothetical protein
LLKQRFFAVASIARSFLRGLQKPSDLRVSSPRQTFFTLRNARDACRISHIFLVDFQRGILY